MNSSSKRRSAEARRANVIYFLNRNGRIEHPHLIRIHHYCHSGVHLRDVKRWLSELRGKEMPESFAWSYQRRYKNGFVWQDLLDDDLITPISGYEYVLLGSLSPNDSSSSPTESTPAAGAAAATAVAESTPEFFRFPAEANNSPLQEELLIVDGISAAPQPPDEEPLPKEMVEDLGKSPAIVTGGRSHSWRASHLFCSFLACRAVETDDSAVLDIPHRIIAAADKGGDGGLHGEVTKTVGSTRPLRRKSWESRPSNGGKSSRKAGRKAMAKPKCSKCGKTFNAEKLHAHMKSCRGLKRSESYCSNTIEKMFGSAKW